MIDVFKNTNHYFIFWGADWIDFLISSCPILGKNMIYWRRPKDLGAPKEQYNPHGKISELNKQM